MMTNKKIFYGIIILLVVMGTGILVYFQFIMSEMPRKSSVVTIPEIQKSSVVTIIVVDAILKQPIENAFVELKQLVVCPAVIGYPCPEGLILKRQTDKEGRTFFYDDKLKELLGKTSIMTTVSAEKYSSTIKELPFNSTDRIITIELIGGNIAVKTRESAIDYSKKDSRLIDWLSKHPNARSYPTVEFESPYWIVEYKDKTTCGHYDPTDINCTIIVKIDAGNGEVIEVLPEG